MGCSAGRPDPALQDELDNLKLLLEDSKSRSVEQQNLLRFKVEVLVNMLAMEEKKSDTTNKRLETLKWLMHSQGVSEQRLTEILTKAGEEEDGSHSAGSRSVALFDLAGAIARMKEDFELFREDILDSLAEKDGKLVANLTAEEFAKQLFVVTDKVSKTDINVLSMRFSDGSGNVSIPEFLEFFTTPASIRAAKSATAAVRMSLDLLQLNGKEDGLEDSNSESDEVTEMDKDGKPVKRIKSPEELREEHLIIRSHRTATLESGMKKLLDLWPHVHGELDLAFTLFEETTEGGLIVSTEVYKKTLTDICGKKSVVLRQAMLDAKEANKKHPIVDAVTAKNAAAWGKPPLDTSKSMNSNKSGAAAANNNNNNNSAPNNSKVPLNEEGNSTPAPEIIPLDEGDIDMLTERFELAGYVHFGHFMQYFRDLERNTEIAARLKSKRVHLPPDMSGISPFRLSSEWISLRKSAEINSYTPPPETPPPPAPVKPEKPDRSLKTPSPAPIVETPKPTPKPESPKVPPKVAESKEKPTAPVKEEKKTEEKKPEDKPTPAPVPDLPAVEEVKSSGCCGGGKKPAPAAPVELPPQPAKEDKKEEDKPELKIEVSKDDSESEDEIQVKKDTKFDTPKGMKQATFKPKLIEPDPEPVVQESHGSRFHRRADRTFENEKQKNPLDEEDDDENTLYKPSSANNKNRYK